MSDDAPLDVDDLDEINPDTEVSATLNWALGINEYSCAITMTLADLGLEPRNFDSVDELRKEVRAAMHEEAYRTGCQEIRTYADDITLEATDDS